MSRVLFHLEVFGVMSGCLSQKSNRTHVQTLLAMRARIDEDLARTEELSARLDEIAAFERVLDRGEVRGLERQELYLELTYLAGSDALSRPSPERLQLGPFAVSGPSGEDLARFLADRKAECEAALQDITARYDASQNGPVGESPDSRTV